MGLSQPLSCTRCWVPLTADRLVPGSQVPCGVCGAELELHLFPALARGQLSGAAGKRTLSAEEATCFYHDGRRAEATCDACGRFLCRLCDIEVGSRRLCPACLETSGGQGGTRLERRRLLYDRVALALAVLPMLVFYVTPLTAAITLFICIRYRKEPSSIAGGRGWRLLLAGLIASAQLVGWVLLAALFIAGLETVMRDGG